MAKAERASPCISIGMPVFNGARFIDEAIRSIVGQTFTDFELIVSDNASTDETAAICLRHQRLDHRIKYVRQPLNIGAVANFQFVLDRAKGRYFMWAACDDFWSKDWVERLYRATQDQGVEASFGQVCHVDEASAPLVHVASDKLFEYRGARFARRLKYFVAFEGGGKANLFYGLFERNLLAGIHVPYFQHDYHVIFHALSRTEIASVPKTYLYKRIHADAASERMVVRRGLMHKLLLRAILPVDVTFLRGYFSDAEIGEKLVLAAALPLKYLCAYPYMLRRLGSTISKSLFRGRTRQSL